MSRLLEKDRQAQWDHRREYGRDEMPARQWCVDTWADKYLSAAQVRAAHRLWAILEGGYAAPASGNLNRVDGGLSDPHARLAAAHSKRVQFEAIERDVRAELATHQHLLVVWDLLFDRNSPQRTAMEMCDKLKCGRSSHRVADYVGRVLDQVAIRFGMLDDDQLAWVKLGLHGAE
jgi:hypothetical protein